MLEIGDDFKRLNLLWSLFLVIFSWYENILTFVHKLWFKQKYVWNMFIDTFKFTLKLKTFVSSAVPFSFSKLWSLRVLISPYMHWFWFLLMDWSILECLSQVIIWKGFTIFFLVQAMQGLSFLLSHNNLTGWLFSHSHDLFCLVECDMQLLLFTSFVVF